MTAEKPRKMVLRGVRPITWNDLYAGKHWRYREKIADTAHGLVREQIDPGDVPFTCRVDITVVVYFDKRPYDPCNIPAKLYIDGFHGWWIKNDTRKYVRRVITQSEIDRKNPRIEITFTPVEE